MSNFITKPAIWAAMLPHCWQFWLDFGISQAFFSSAAQYSPPVWASTRQLIQVFHRCGRDLKDVP
ncbi:MAG: hypothetical protein EXR77_18065 [Myxococcales bacterium]|nr:hypothetical protein [Myxococcales bacterium]